jgi:hypothetical protein
MAKVDSPRRLLTVNLPSDLIEELKVVALHRQVSLDEVVMEACLAYSEPYLWEKAYVQWRNEHPNVQMQEFGADGRLLSSSAVIEAVDLH